MADIAGPNGFVAHPGGGSGQLQDLGHQFRDGDGFAVSGVEDPLHPLGLGGVGERPDDVLHEDEVAGLSAVPVDGDRLPVARAVEEDRDGGGVGAAGILTRAEDIEETEARRGEPSLAGVESAVVFAVELGDGVGTAGIGRHGLDLGLDRVLSVDGGGAGEAEFPHTVPAGGLQDVEQAVDIQIDGLTRHGHRLRDTHHGGEVEDIVRACHEFVEQGAVEDRSLHEAALQPVQIPAMAGAQVVQDHDLGAFLIVLHDMASDEAASAGDEDLHGELTQWDFINRSPVSRRTGASPPPGIRCWRPVRVGYGSGRDCVSGAWS